MSLTDSVAASGGPLLPPLNHSPTSWKPLFFALIIILGIGGWVVAGVGLGGYLQVGSLSNLGQVQSISMMAIGSSVGILCLIVGIVSVLKNCQTRSPTQNIVSNRSRTTTRTPAPAIDTQKRHLFGPDAYKVLNIEIVGKVPPPPKFDEKEDPFFNKPIDEHFPLIYIPARIRVNGVEKDLTLNTFNQLLSERIRYLAPTVKTQFADVPLQQGWRRISRDLIPDSIDKTYVEQKRMVENKGYRPPHALEIVIFVRLVQAITHERLYNEGVYTRCHEKVDPKHPIVVRNSSITGLAVDDYFMDGGYVSCGIGAVKCYP